MRKNKALPEIKLRRLHQMMPDIKRDEIESAASIAERNVLIITNSSSRYQLQFGKEFRNDLEARDQVLQHEFTFNFNLNDSRLLERDEPFLESNLYIELKKSIKRFLVESISNVVSAGFKHLCRNELTENEAKEFASKNIMINLEAIFRETISAIEGSPFLKKKVEINDLKDQLVVEIDCIISNVLVNLADSYPQAAASGGTPRMRENITEVNRSDDIENDFIFNADIKIGDYLSEDGTARQDGDYTEFIMKVFNAATQITQENQQDSRERTVFQKFTDFNEHLFWVTRQKPYQRIISSLDEGKRIKGDFEGKEQRKINERVICDKFDTILDNHYKEESKIRGSAIFNKIDNIWEEAEEGIAEMKALKEYALGQKIPATLKPFNRQEISSKLFSAKHSSILRVLTKWASSLEEIFEIPDEFVKRRQYPFKNTQNEMVHLVYTGWGEESGANKLISNLEEEYKEVQRKFNEMLKTSYGFIGNFLSKRDSRAFISSVNRFSDTRSNASKINAVLTSLMLNYTNLLIHHLLKAGEDILTDEHNQNINLISFRVTDLMRSKFQCTENTFVNVLRTMYLLDNSETMKGKFKLVRIKNKLDDPSNNIMINYLFMGRVQCELQLSIHEAKGREKNYYTFSHFVYQLTRGKFGSISECAIMVSQLDPMITACKSTYYEEKQIEPAFSKAFNPEIFKKVSKEEEHAKQRAKQEEEEEEEEAEDDELLTTSFECVECGRLITNEHPEKFVEEQFKTLCYQCIVGKGSPEKFMKAELKEILQRINENHMKTYDPLVSLDKEKFLVNLSPSGELSLNIVSYLPKEFKTFTVKVDTKVLEDIDSDDFDFTSLDYIDISRFIKEGITNSKPPTVLTYLFDDIKSVPKDVFEMSNISEAALQNLALLVSEFREWRQEKNMVKTIKYKAEIIKCNKEEWKIIDKVCRLLALGEKGKEKGMVMKYKKHKHLDLSNIKQITANRVELDEIPKWVRECRNLKILEFEHNQLKGAITGEQLPINLTHINLSSNHLESIDISGLNSLYSLNLSRNEFTTFNLGSNVTLNFLWFEENKLASFNLSNNNSIRQLFIQNNPFLKEVPYLPPSMEILVADREAIIHYDFSPLLNLQKLEVEKGEVKREEVINLMPQAVFNCWNR